MFNEKNAEKASGRIPTDSRLSLFQLWGSEPRQLMEIRGSDDLRRSSIKNARMMTILYIKDVRIVRSNVNIAVNPCVRYR